MGSTASIINYHALVIGIDYGKQHKLPGVKANVAAMENLLIKKMGVKKSNLKVMYGKYKRDDLKKKLQKFFSTKFGPDAHILVYFTGFGEPVRHRAHGNGTWATYDDIKDKRVEHFSTRDVYEAAGSLLKQCADGDARLTLVADTVLPPSAHGSSEDLNAAPEAEEDPVLAQQAEFTSRYYSTMRHTDEFQGKEATLFTRALLRSVWAASPTPTHRVLFSRLRSASEHSRDENNRRRFRSALYIPASLTESWWF